MFEVDAEFARREVLDMADGRHHGVTPAEVFGDGARFRGGFDDNERLRHSNPIYIDR